MKNTLVQCVDCEMLVCRLRSDVLPLVQSLCHDVDGEVRMCMCQHLPAIARALGYDATDTGQ